MLQASKVLVPGLLGFLSKDLLCSFRVTVYEVVGRRFRWRLSCLAVKALGFKASGFEA